MGYLDLFWEIADTTEDVLDYTFSVERSESPEGPFDPISGEFSDTYIFRDALVQPYRRWRQLWYRLRVKHKDGGYKHTDPVTQEPEPTLETKEMRRAVTLLLKKGIGRIVWVFPIRTFGQKCPSCWDNLQQKTITSKCESCYNTGYARGFMDPIATYAQFDPSGKSVSHGPTVQTEQQNTTVLTPYYPPLKPKDVIVEPENRRWRVVSINESSRFRAPIRQRSVVHEVPKSDIEFKLPINIDNLSQLQPTPDRDFVNPHTPSEGGSDIASILSAYGFNGC